jgi:metallo-beta-lactamase family protein
LNAEVAVLNSFSAHADQTELVSYITGINLKRLKRIFLVHGEIEQSEKLAAKLKENHVENIEIPEMGQKVEL